MENYERPIDDKVVMTVRAMIRSINYADAARMLFIIMYGDKHFPEFGCGVDDDGNAHLNIYMNGEECCMIKRIISCEIILSAKDPANVVYKELEDMHRLLMSYEEKENK